MSGEVKPPKDESNVSQVKPNNKSLDLSKNKITQKKENDAQSENSGGKSTHKLEGTPGISNFDHEWRVLTDYWRNSGQLEDVKRRADKLGIDLPDSFTQKLGSGSLEHDSVLDVEPTKDPPSPYDTLSPPPYAPSDHYSRLQPDITQKPDARDATETPNPSSSKAINTARIHEKLYRVCDDFMKKIDLELYRKNG